MQRFEALTPATFKNGRFKLTPEQMRRRRYVVNVIDAEQLIVEPKGEISFKRGEIVETDVVIGKGNTTLKALDEAPVEASPLPSPASAPAADGAPSTTEASAQFADSPGEHQAATGEAPAEEPPGDAQPADDPLADIPDAPPPTTSRRRR